MSACKTCGREDEGHYLGCKAVAGDFWAEAEQLVDGDKVVAGTVCAHGDCENPPRPPGKGPKPKFCEEHSDPKNRK